MVAGLKSKDKSVYIIRGVLSEAKTLKGENVKGKMLCNPTLYMQKPGKRQIVSF